MVENTKNYIKAIILVYFIYKKNIIIYMYYKNLILQKCKLTSIQKYTKIDLDKYFYSIINDIFFFEKTYNVKITNFVDIKYKNKNINIGKPLYINNHYDNILGYFIIKN